MESIGAGNPPGQRIIRPVRGMQCRGHRLTPVTPMLPLQAVWSEVFRITHGGDVLGPQQRIGTMAALRTVTIDAAWQVLQDDNRGSLEPGEYADLVILSGNPLDDPMAMRERVVEQTLVGGATVYRAVSNTVQLQVK